MEPGKLGQVEVRIPRWSTSGEQKWSNPGERQSPGERIRLQDLPAGQGQPVDAAPEVHRQGSGDRADPELLGKGHRASLEFHRHRFGPRAGRTPFLNLPAQRCQLFRRGDLPGRAHGASRGPHEPNGRQAMRSRTLAGYTPYGSPGPESFSRPEF